MADPVTLAVYTLKTILSERFNVYPVASVKLHTISASAEFVNDNEYPDLNNVSVEPVVLLYNSTLSLAVSIPPPPPLPTV